MILKQLKLKYEEACDGYLREFCSKNGFDYEPDMWVAGDVGTIAMVGDMFVTMSDIRYDVDNNIPNGKFYTWYWKNLELHEYDIPYMNYESYCNGAPDKYTDVEMKKIREGRDKINKAKREFEDLIRSFKEN